MGRPKRKKIRTNKQWPISPLNSFWIHWYIGNTYKKNPKFDKDNVNANGISLYSFSVTDQNV